VLRKPGCRDQHVGQVARETVAHHHALHHHVLAVGQIVELA
jgi:hypothetical protein